jgi:ABC-2 type transport system ATP-binding protein
MTNGVAVQQRTQTKGIVADDVTMTFDDEDVVRSLDLTVEPGSIVGLIGPSGCGKTTTVRILTGLLTPTSGVATIDGVPSHHLTARQRTRIGYLPQSPALFSDLSVWENLNFHASMYGLALRRRKRLRQLLDWVELTDDSRKRVRDTSGGMQRRLALAATFVHDPSFLFLDEPTAGIDPILREKFWTQFRTLASEGRTLLVTTQYVGEASFCDYVGLLSDGELLMFDTPQNLRRAAFDGEVIDVVLQRAPSDEQLAALADLPLVIGDIERVDHVSVRIVVRDAGEAIAEIGSCLDTLGLEAVEATEHVVDYDEAFVRVVERHRASSADTVEVPA